MPANSREPVFYVRRLRPPDARNAARLERHTYGRMQRAGRKHIRTMLTDAERRQGNLSIGLFRNAVLVGCILAVKSTDRAGLFARFEVAVPRGADLGGESIYVEDIILDRRAGKYAFTLIARSLSEFRRRAPGLPLDAFCAPDVLSRWKKYTRGFRHAGYEMAAALPVADLAGESSWYWVSWRPCDDNSASGAVNDDPSTVWQSGETDGCRVVLIQNVQQWLSIKDQWRSLAGLTEDADAFSVFDVQFEWWRQFGGDHSLAILAAVRDNEVVGIAPLMITVRYLLFRYVRELSFIGDSLLMERPKFLMRPGDAGAEQMLWAGILAIRSNWQFATMHEQVPGWPGKGAESELNGVGCRIVSGDSSRAPCVVNSFNGWDHYLSSRSRSFRKSIRRKLRRIRETGAVRITVRYGHECRTLLKEYLALEKRSWKASSPDGLCNRREHIQVFQRLLDAKDLDARFKFALLKVDDAIVSATFGIEYLGRYSSLEICHDSSLKSLSPGIALTALEINDWLSRSDCREFDFLSGSLANKVEWATTVRVTDDVHILPNDWYGAAIERWLLTIKPALKTTLKRMGIFNAVYRFSMRTR